MACAIQETSPGAYDAETLGDGAEIDHYLLREKYRDSLLWDIRTVQHEGETYYTIRNCAHKDGFLTWVNETSLYGYWCRVLSDDEREAHETGKLVKGAVESYLPYGKPLAAGAGWVGRSLFGTETLTEGIANTTGVLRYFKGSQEGHNTNYSPDILWKISKAEEEKYILQNGGKDFYKPDLGILSCANTPSPGGKRVQILYNFEESAYRDVYRINHGIGGALRSSVRWELSLETIAEGFYTITNCFLRGDGDPARGRLSGSKIASNSGYYVEVLNGKEPGGNHGDADVWEVRKVLDEGGLYYTIRNSACPEGGWLTWTYNNVSKRSYLQILTDNKQYLCNNYPGNQAK